MYRLIQYISISAYFELCLKANILYASFFYNIHASFFRSVFLDLGSDMSYNLLLVLCQYHGGTNFGRTTGGPFIATSYDYDAPIDEYGKLDIQFLFCI